MPKGVVAKVSAREWNDLTLYSIKLEGDEKWYRAGERNPADAGVEAGVSISFDLTAGGNVAGKSLKVVKGDAGVTRAPAPTASKSSSKDDYWSQKEARDVEKDSRYQKVDIPRMTFCGAQETAVKVVELALAQGAITLGTKKNAQLDILMETIQQVAVQLFRARMEAPDINPHSDDNEEEAVASDEGNTDDE